MDHPIPSVSPPREDRFDLKRLRISQDFADTVGVKKALLTVPVRKPDKQWFVRVHPNEEYRLSVAVLELKEERHPLGDLAPMQSGPGIAKEMVPL